jgi:hypothetical protein
MIIDYNNPDCFCPYCEDLLDDDGSCPNDCDYELEDYLLDEDDLIYEDDFYDIIPGYDFYLEDFPDYE